MAVIDMAIVIPSAKIYEKQNPKVRDNTIERIEVSAKKVVSQNEFDTTVFIKEYEQDFINTNGGFGDLIYGSSVGKEYAGSVYSNGYGVVYLSLEPYYLPKGDKNSKITVAIPKIIENSSINNIQTGTNINGNKIGFSISYVKYSGKAEGNCIVSNDEATNFNITNLEYLEESNIIKSTSLPLNLSHSYTWISENVQGQSYTQTVNIEEKVNSSLIDNLSTAFIYSDDEYFYIDLKLFCAYKRISMGGYTPPKVGGTPTNNVSVSLSGNVEVYDPVSVELTFKGNKIGIALKNETVYINGETQKKVYGAYGNELMQTSNYWKPTAEKTIQKEFSKTLSSYAKGKETATIRCSIGDYYDYDSGEKVISVDSLTERMCFRIYDQVIPMVYNNLGQDEPMSKLKDGSPKVFQVLGRRIFYNGAVWQELYLQEV